MGRGREPISNNFYDQFFDKNNLQTVLVDKISSTEYIIGRAKPGTGESEFGWQISKHIVKDAETEIIPAIQNGSYYNLRWEDRLTAFDPDIPLDGSPYDIVLSNSTLIDGTPVDSLVGFFTTLSNDPDRIYTYSLIDDADGTFRIEDDALILSAVPQLSQGTYFIRVRTVDDQGRDFEQDIALGVLPVPEFSDNRKINLNGIDQYLTNGRLGEYLSQLDSHSFSIWLDPTQPSSTLGNGELSLYVDSDNYLQFGFINGVLTFVYAKAGVVLTRTYNHSATSLINFSYTLDYTNDELIVYENGATLSTASDSNPSYSFGSAAHLDGGQFFIGLDGSSRYSYMCINDVSFWGVELTPAEIAEIAQAEPTDLYTHSNSDELRGWWTFESGNAGEDETGLFDLTFINQGDSSFSEIMQNYVAIDPDRSSDEIIGTTSPRVLGSGQLLVEVSNDNDQYLTQYIKYSASFLRTADLSQELKSFIFDPRTVDKTGEDAWRTEVSGGNIDINNLNGGLLFQADETISAVKAVTATSNTNVELADTDTCENATVLGVSMTAASAGNQTRVQLGGEFFDSSLTFAMNEAVYLGANGLLTNVAPVTGFRTKVGHGLGPGGILIRIEEPIELA